MKKDIDKKFGIVVEKNEKSLYIAMKEVLKNEYRIKQKFDPERFNENILNFVENLF